MSQNINGYLLVKGKDGQMQYYKDGKFYSLDDIQKKNTSPVETSANTVPKKVTLKPVLTFEDRQKIATEKLPALPARQVTPPIAPKPLVSRPIAPVEATVKSPVVSVEPVTSTPAKQNIFSLDSIDDDDDVKNRRIQDKELVFKRTQEVIDKLKIQFTDEQIKNRFTNILHTYFRGIRGKSEVEYMLTLSRAAGGLELPREKATMIVSVLTHHSEATAKERRDIVVKPKEKIIPVSVEKKENLTPLAPIPTRVQPVAPPRQMAQPAVLRPTDMPRLNPQTKVGDIHMKNKLVGPIEELTYMTLADFRLLGRNLTEITASLSEKIQLLADESLGRKVQGIKAWKQSPVFMLYLAMSMQGILQGQTMEQVIIEKQRNHEDCLTLSEFEAISRLNSQLVY